MDRTGYDPSPDPDELEPGTKIEWRLVPFDRIHTSGLLGQVTRNGTPVGVVRFVSQDEFDWLKRRLDGDFVVPLEKRHADRE